MMRICPKCSDYSADPSLGFCLHDGMPLVNVDPSSASWNEGTQVLEEKKNALRKLRRKLMWRRILVSAMTMLITTLLVATSFTVETTPAEPPPSLSASLVPPPLPSPSPSSSPSPSPSPSPFPSPSPSQSPSPSPSRSPSQSPSPSPAPSAVYKISGRVMDASQPLGGVKIMLDGAKTASTITDAKGSYTFSDLRPGGSYSLTPAKAKVNFMPPSRSINNLRQDGSADFLGLVQPDVYRISGRVMNASQPLGGVKIRLAGSKLALTTSDGNGNYTFTDLRAGGSYTITPVSENVNLTPASRSYTKLTRDESAHFSGLVQVDSTPTQVCTEGDKSREKDILLNRYGAIWQRSIESEKRKIIADSVPVGVEPNAVEATAIIGPITYEVTFSKGCTPRMVTATYEWQVRTNVNGKTRVVAVPKQKTCRKVLAVWLCR